jgi:hypothetical protein
MQSYLVGVLSQLPLPRLLPILQLLRYHMQSKVAYWRERLRTMKSRSEYPRWEFATGVAAVTVFS